MIIVLRISKTFGILIKLYTSMDLQTKNLLTVYWR
jgi:hypothetical protein